MVRSRDQLTDEMTDEQWDKIEWVPIKEDGVTSRKFFKFLLAMSTHSMY